MKKLSKLHEQILGTKELPKHSDSFVKELIESFSPELMALLTEANSPLKFDKGTDKHLPPAEQDELLIKWREDKDLEARNMIIQANYKRILKIAHKLKFDKRFCDDNVNVMVGVEGMVRALDTFDMKRIGKVKLSTFLATSVKGYMLNNINKKDNYHSSLDIKLKGKEGAEGKTRGDNVHDDKDDVEAQVYKTDDIKRMRLVIANLKGDDKEVIKDYFGLESGKSMTFKEVGEKHNMSKVGMRKKITKILALLKKKM